MNVQYVKEASFNLDAWIVNIKVFFNLFGGSHLLTTSFKDLCFAFDPKDFNCESFCWHFQSEKELSINVKSKEPYSPRVESRAAEQGRTRNLLRHRDHSADKLVWPGTNLLSDQIIVWRC